MKSKAKNILARRKNQYTSYHMKYSKLKEKNRSEWLPPNGFYWKTNLHDGIGWNEVFQLSSAFFRDILLLRLFKSVITIANFYHNFGLSCLCVEDSCVYPSIFPKKEIFLKIAELHSNFIHEWKKKQQQKMNYLYTIRILSPMKWIV